MIDLIEDYTWADEDCDLLTKNQIEYHKGVRFSDILSEQTCVVIQYSYRFTFKFGINMDEMYIISSNVSEDINFYFRHLLLGLIPIFEKLVPRLRI